MPTAQCDRTSTDKEHSYWFLSRYSRGKQESCLSCPRQGSQLCPFLPALWSQLFYMKVCAIEEAREHGGERPALLNLWKANISMRLPLPQMIPRDARLSSSLPNYSAQLKTQSGLHLQTFHHPPQRCCPLLQMCPVFQDILWFSWALVLLGHQSIL